MAQKFTMKIHHNRFDFHGLYSRNRPSHGLHPSPRPRSAPLSMNGRFASGSPWPEPRGDREGSSCTLAGPKTWVKPKS